MPDRKRKSFSSYSQVTHKNIDVPFIIHAGIPADEVARLLGTINYEIVCAVSGRVPRVYLQG
jgi:alanine racemase